MVYCQGKSPHGHFSHHVTTLIDNNCNNKYNLEWVSVNSDYSKSATS